MEYKVFYDEKITTWHRNVLYFEEDNKDIVIEKLKNTEDIVDLPEFEDSEILFEHNEPILSKDEKPVIEIFINGNLEFSNAF